MNLVTIRKERGLSQGDLAAHLGLKSKTSISEIEKTGTAPPEVALKIEEWSGGAVRADTLSPIIAKARAPLPSASAAA